MNPARILAIFLVCAAAFAAPVARAAERSCVVGGVEGTEVRLWHQGTWSEATPGAVVAPESKVATGPNSRINIACDDGLTVTIGASTEANLEQIVGPSGPGTSAMVQLIRGIIGIIAPNRTWGLFEVRTPIAIASVRSTEWLVEHGESDGTAVFVRKGVVEVGSGGTVSTLNPGDGVTLTRKGEPATVKQWGAERVARSGAALGFGWK